MKKQQRQQAGGTIIGFIVGVIVGLGAALAVAVYVTKVPVPFLNKGNGRAADMDAAESQKNKNWDPNSPLYGKNPARPV
ncbi:MAG: sporulation protein, partial [Acidovorax sp.]